MWFVAYTITWNMSVLKYEHENNGEEAVNSIMGGLLREINSETLDLAF